jgi:hypothetical protein
LIYRQFSSVQSINSPERIAWPIFCLQPFAVCRLPFAVCLTINPPLTPPERGTFRLCFLLPFSLSPLLFLVPQSLRLSSLVPLRRCAILLPLSPQPSFQHLNTLRCRLFYDLNLPVHWYSNILRINKPQRGFLWSIIN